MNRSAPASIVAVSQIGLDQPRLGPAAFRVHGERPALVSTDSTITFGELADRIERRAARLGTVRQLVALVAANEIEFVVTLLAAFHGRHPVIVVDGQAGLASLAGYAPEVIARPSEGTITLDTRSAGRPEPMHEDLALLMSTSGSTGASKLVRLSLDAVNSNAMAIASYLRLGPSDVGITSLPLSYCYGLSVVTSHLAVGANVVLTDLSVVDPCFAELVATREVTGLAGVPHTFDMLERSGSGVLAAPSLRFVTQAGGRLDPGHVQRLAEVGRRDGFDFYVMYGQTEATARMAYLDPSETLDAPHVVGRAIPGGELQVLDPDRRGVGEIVFRGPNVMMGYATGRGDLARGHDLDELRTGDLGRFDECGRLEIVGRSSRIAKIHGKRIDLDHLESELALVGPAVRCAGGDDNLVVAAIEAGIEHPTPDRALARVAADLASIPPGRVAAARVAEFPVTTSGKPDAPALTSIVRSAMPQQASDTTGGVSEAFALVFDRQDLEPDATFSSLGGDSFSYVEMSTRLERALGALPAGWHLMSIRELERLRSEDPPRRRWTSQIETSVVIRAIAILLIVCTHMRVFRLAGGAHTLLAVVGWNFARFQLSDREVPGRLRRSLDTVARIAVPTSVWIGLNMVVAGGYGVAALFLVNNYMGDAERSGGRWEYWYFETFVQASIVLALLFAIPAVRRIERRAPFVFAVGVLGLTWLFRFDIVQWGGAYNEVFRPHTVASFIALGWCAQRADAVWQKLAVTAATLVTTFGYFGSVGYVDQFDREARIALMIAALVWIPTVRLPRILTPIVATIAAASMWIFLVHWQVWPALTPIMDDDVAFWLTIASGVAVWWVTERVQAWWSQRRTIGRRTSSQVSRPDNEIKASDATPVSA